MSMFSNPYVLIGIAVVVLISSVVVGVVMMSSKKKPETKKPDDEDEPLPSPPPSKPVMPVSPPAPAPAPTPVRSQLPTPQRYTGTCKAGWHDAKSQGYSCPDNETCKKDKNFFQNNWGCDKGGTEFYFTIPYEMGNYGCQLGWNDNATQGVACPNNNVCNIQKSKIAGAWGCDNDGNVFYYTK